MRTFEAIIRAYGRGLARVAASYEADRGLREDLLQEILLAIHRALPTLRDEASLGPFVFRIAHNRGVTHAMRARDAKRRATFDVPVEPSATPEQHVLTNERLRRLEKAVRRLPLPYRQVITLVFEELSYEEIGEALGLSASNVAVRVNRAKVQLKEFLDEG